MHRGWIKLHRKLLDSSIRTKPLVLALWIDLLLKANHKPNNFLWNGKEITIDRGQVLTGRKVLAEETGLSQQNVRTILKLLKSTNKITIKTFTKFSIITVNNYRVYQGDGQQANQQLTNNQPTTNQQLTTNKNDKKNKNDKNIGQFNSLWLKYPKKRGKVEAEKTYIRLAKKDADIFGKLDKAIEAYANECKLKNTEEQYILQGSTFFNGRWEDYTNIVKKKRSSLMKEEDCV